MIDGFLYENLNFLCENFRFSSLKILMIFFMILSTIHKISYYKARISTGSVETRWLGGSFLMVYSKTLAGWICLASSVCA